MITWLLLLAWLLGSAGAGALTSWVLFVTLGRRACWYLLPVFVAGWAAAGLVALLSATALIGWRVK